MDQSTPALDCWYLTGATAVGKTEIGLELAERLGAEIISLDSMAVYRGMDIGTAKPSSEDQARVAHHLIDLVDPSEDFSIDCYLQHAHESIAEIRSRGREVLFVGGTPLYLKALLRGLSSGPPADWELRKTIEAEVAEVGSLALHERLQQLDPVAASQIHPHDTRRLIRAVEVFRLTGEPISHAQLHFEEPTNSESCRAFVLQRSREERNTRINDRVDQMLERGLVDEVRHLTSDERHLGRTASQAVGYREVIDYLSGSDYDEMVAKIKARTRRFAKRQQTWFRSMSECRPIVLSESMSSSDVAEQIAAVGRV